VKAGLVLLAIVVVATLAGGCGASGSHGSSGHPTSGVEVSIRQGCVATAADFRAMNDRCIPERRSLLCAIRYTPGGRCKVAVTFASSQDIGCRNGEPAAESNLDGYVPDDAHAYCAHVFYLANTRAAHRSYTKILRAELNHNLQSP
jgi:hypothetical protein